MEYLNPDEILIIHGIMWYKERGGRRKISMQLVVDTLTAQCRRNTFLPIFINTCDVQIWQNK